MIKKHRLFISVCLIVLLTVGLSDAQSYTVRPTGSNHDQDVINEALKDAAKNGGGTVYLENSGTNYVFITNGPIQIPSGNIVLTGDSGIIVRVYSGADAVQWFTGTNSIITATGQIDNLEIYGFQIDGSCDKLPFEFHHSRSDTAHDCERAIYVQGSSGRFNNNIRVHDMRITNCFSDGIHIRFANSVHCYSNFISNCQHEGIFWTCVINGLIEGNKISGITSDCLRCDNCVSNIIQNNYLLSYTGNQNNQAPKGFNKGIQVADAGSSQGYNANNKPTHTTDIIIRWNTFANCGTQAIWLDSTGKGYDNVYIYNNTFIGVEAVTNDGHDFTLNITETTEGMQNYNNLTENIQPSIETSENIFSSIFDFLNMKVYTQVGQNDTVVLPEGMKNSSSEATGTIEYHSIGTETFTLIRIPSEELSGVSKVEYNINGKTASRTLMIGERSGLKVTFTSTDVWTGEFSHENGALKLNGTIPAEAIKIKCVTPRGSFTPTLETKQVNFVPLKVHPAMIVLFIALLLFIIFIKRSLKHMM